jgi:hypothetical protein
MVGKDNFLSGKAACNVKKREYCLLCASWPNSAGLKPTFHVRHGQKHAAEDHGFTVVGDDILCSKDM